MSGHESQIKNVALEYKSIPLQLSDLDKEHGIVVIAHATYDNIDRSGDIARAGMFNKSWTENKASIGFFINHDPMRVPGVTQDFFEDKAHGYTKAKFGNYTLGRDTLEMVDMGVIKDASFSFKALKSNFLNIKGKKIRELKEVFHGETSLVYGIPSINPLSGVVLLKKAGEPFILELKSRLENMEKFCRDTTASDECITGLLEEIKAINQIISEYDTANTLDEEPDASDNEMNDDNEQEIRTMLSLLHSKIAI